MQQKKKIEKVLLNSYASTIKVQNFNIISDKNSLALPFIKWKRKCECSLFQIIEILKCNSTRSTRNWHFEKWLMNSLQINTIRCKKQLFQIEKIQYIPSSGLSCRHKSDCLFKGPRIMRWVPCAEAFLRDPSFYYLHEFRRKPWKTSNRIGRETRPGLNPVHLIYQLKKHNFLATAKDPLCQATMGKLSCLRITICKAKYNDKI